MTCDSATQERILLSRFAQEVTDELDSSRSSRQFRPSHLRCSVFLTSTAFAGGKQYPTEGIVSSVGTTQDTSGGDKMPIITHTYRTYVLKTPERILTLKCPYDMDSLHIFSPSECGGKKKIALGDILHFRVSKRYAYIQTSEGKEQRLEVLTEAVNEERAQILK